MGMKTLTDVDDMVLYNYDVYLTPLADMVVEDCKKELSRIYEKELRKHELDEMSYDILFSYAVYALWEKVSSKSDSAVRNDIMMIRLERTDEFDKRTRNLNPYEN